MSRILLPTIDFPPARGGVARYIGAITQTFPDQVKLLALKKGKLDQLIFRLLWTGRSFDAIWTHHVLPIGTAAMIVKKMTGKPYVVFLHGLDFDLARRNPWKQALTKHVLRSAARVVTNSQALATEVRAFVELDREPLVIYPTLNDELVATSKLPQAKSEKVNLKKLGELALGVSRSATPMFVAAGVSGLKLLTVARLVERKGHLKVLEALTQIPEATYHIVGSGPMLGTIQAKVQELGLQDRVRITTDAADDALPEIYRAADIFVMPTTKTERDREGFGIVYLEAQVFGVPVIATRHPGVDEAVKDGEGGILIPDTPQELLTAITRLKDSKVRSTLGARGRARVLHEFTREQQMYKLRELL